MTAEGRTAEGRTAESRTAEGRTAEGRTAESRTAEGRTAESRTAEGRTAEGRTALGMVLGLVLGLVFVHAVRANLQATYEKARLKYDIYSLPSPQRVVNMSLGYRSALADLLFAHVLVESGLHLEQRRRFQTVAAYLRTINELDPKFATPYHFADTLITLQAGKPTLQDYRDAREILERGMRELPYDTELWLTSGEYLAYLAAPHVGDLAGAEEEKAWRLEGARRLAHTCEIIGTNDAVPQHCVVAASLFSHSGEHEALMKFVERVLAVSDDPSVHEQALAALARSASAGDVEKMRQHRDRLDAVKKNDLPFVGKDRFLLVGPRFVGYACLGAARERAACATSLRDWHQRIDREGSAPPGDDQG